MTSICCVSLVFHYRGSSYPIANVPNSHHDIETPEENERSSTVLMLIFFQNITAVRAKIKSSWTELATFFTL